MALGLSIYTTPFFDYELGSLHDFTLCFSAPRGSFRFGRFFGHRVRADPRRTNPCQRSETPARRSRLRGIRGAVLAIGFLRVIYFEKGATYYFHSAPFIAKLSLFAIIGLVSIYPTVEFLSWRKAVKQGQIPIVSARKLESIRTIIHLEVAGVVFIILCAALMAKGVGYVG
jgi:uncharacterized membrane protein